MKNRIKDAYNELKKQRLDALLITSDPNITYLTQYQSRDSYLLISKGGNIFFTDSRYTQEAQQKLKGLAQVCQVNGQIVKKIAQICAKSKIKHLGFEEKRLPYYQYRRIRDALGNLTFLDPTSGIIENLREIKDEGEAKFIRKAVEITAGALKFIKPFIKAGRKEIEIAAEIERFIRYNKAQYSSFNIIVASGPNTSFPHHITSERKLQNNESVLIDLGVDYKGYKSDLTRTFFLGKIQPLEKKIYNIVLEAQQRAIEQIKDSVRINTVDSAARKHIADKGYGKFFGHSLGHGIGLEIHETPTISPQESRKLRSGMIFTVEPGIYLPGKFGIRIEDMVLVTKKGCEVLSGTINK